jgi:hypothetical protein
LHHQHGLLRLVLFPDVLHQVREGAAVTLESFCSESGEDIEFISISGDGSRETLCVALHPSWCVTGETVFPTAEPQHHQVEALFPRDIDPMVQYAVVETSFRWFYLLPCHRREDGVHVHLGNARKDAVCLSRGPSGRISHFASQDQVWFPVDDQLSPGSRLRNPR